MSRRPIVTCLILALVALTAPASGQMNPTKSPCEITRDNLSVIMGIQATALEEAAAKDRTSQQTINELRAKIAADTKKDAPKAAEAKPETPKK